MGVYAKITCFWQALKLYYHTLRHLKWIQILGRIFFKLKKIKPNLAPAPAKRLASFKWQAPVLKSISMLAPDHFFFLNETFLLKNQTDWNNATTKKLILYNLHYFDDLNAFNFIERKVWHNNLITRWINENPPGFGNGWEPYTLSLRIVNWIKWDLNGQTLSQDLLNSLATQTRFLTQHLEFHLLGNHLLANAKALIFAGLFFNGDEANAWLATGLKIFSTQLKEQILADGGHFELSPMYHSIILEDVLDVINLLQTYEQAIPEPWMALVPNMCQWLHTMCHPDGEISLFNDTAFKIAPKLRELTDYAQRLNICCPSPSASQSIYLKESGYAHLVKADLHVIADVANLGPDYLPGHGHADTLSFELSCHAQRIIVNSGTSLYENNAERLYQRSTAAHNTIVIDQKNSSNVWSSFRVAERAKTFNIDFQDRLDSVLLSASHNGYQRLSDKITHQRMWWLNKNTLVLTDKLIGKKSHSIEFALHFHPDIQIIRKEANYFVLCNQEKILAHVNLDAALQVNLVDSTYHPEFGSAIPNKKLLASTNTLLPVTLTHIFIFNTD